MSTKSFDGVADTLFIPLAARVAASTKFPEYFCDKKSLELADIDAVKRINAKSNEYTMLASISRYYCIDRFATTFIQKNKECGIVCLGVGLETMNYRVTSAGVHYYQVDFPSVIENRSKVLGEAENETLIGCDITDIRWTEQVDKTKPLMLIASGVFQYFKEEAVLKFISDMKRTFPGAELVFDATNEVGIRYAQKYVKKTGNTSAMMYFFINDAAAFAEQAGVRLLESRGFYAETRKIIGKKTGLYTRIAMKVADDKKRTILIKVKLI
ncbi:MAG: class I SAM-dependent methyltransferase [Clostridia bacterium]|nr:class I SAM-dependent methyltransferase [Clostridia bacterium]